MHPTHNPNTSALAGISPADILRGAALYLRRHGWHQGTYYPEHHATAFPPACAEGAIRTAACGRPVRFHDDLTRDERRLVRAADIILASYLDGDYDRDRDDDAALDAAAAITAWNDEDWRTRREVIDLLTDAADDYDHAATDGRGAR
jgi:hypothetical protein